MAPGPDYLHGRFLTIIHFKVSECSWLYAMFWVVKVLTEHCKYRQMWLPVVVSMWPHSQEAFSCIPCDQAGMQSSLLDIIL